MKNSLIVEKSHRIKKHEGKVVCPRCDGNGLIYKAYIKSQNIHLLICDECEATWKNIDDILNMDFKDLTIYLESKGLDCQDLNKEKFNYNWHK